MKKDLKNVTATFSLVVCMALGNTWLYTKDALAEQANLKQQTEYGQKELLAQQSMQLLLLTKSIEADIPTLAIKPVAENKTVKAVYASAPKPDPIPTTNSAPAATSQPASVLESQIQAEAQAAAKREADALAKQIAAAKAAAKKEAAEAAAAKEKSRKSSAS